MGMVNSNFGSNLETKKKFINNNVKQINNNSYSINDYNCKEYLEDRIEFKFKIRTKKLLEKLSKLRIEDYNKNK